MHPSFCMKERAASATRGTSAFSNVQGASKPAGELIEFAPVISLGLSLSVSGRRDEADILHVDASHCVRLQISPAQRAAWLPRPLADPRAETVCMVDVRTNGHHGRLDPFQRFVAD